MDSEALPTNQATDEIAGEKKVVNEEKDMKGETISHPKETTNVDEEAKLKLGCSTNVEAAVNEAGEKSENKNQTIVEDVKKDTESSNSVLSDSVVLSGQVEEEEAKSRQRAADKVHEEESKKQHESDTLELSPGSVEKAVGKAEELPAKEPESEAAKDQVVSESGNELEAKDPEVTDISTIPSSISDAEDTKEEPVVGRTIAEEEEAKPQQEAADKVHEEESKKQYESETLEVSPGSVEKAVGNTEEILAKEPESEAAKDQVVSEFANELEAKDPEVTEISTIPSSISETEDTKEEPLVVCTIAEEEAAKPQQEAADEVHEEEPKKQHKSDTPEGLPGSVEKAVGNAEELLVKEPESEAAKDQVVSEFAIELEAKDQEVTDISTIPSSISETEDIKEEPVVACTIAEEEEAQPQQEAADKVHEEESKKQHKSETLEVSPGPVEKAVGNTEEILAKEPESEAANDQVVSELGNELEAKDPEVTEISTIPSSISETEDTKEEPVVACVIAGPAAKENVEASKDEEFVVEAHVTGEHSEEKISNSNRLEDEMKVEENFASESIDTVPVAAELMEAGGAVALEASDKLEKSDGGFLPQKDIKETVKERIESCEAEDTVKEVVVGAGLTEPPTAINPTKTIVAKSAVGTAEETLEPEVKITDDKQETLTEVEEPVMDQENEANSASEIAQVLTKEETAIGDLEMVKDEDETLENKNEGPLETTCLVKEVVADIGVPKIPAFVNPAEFSSATLAMETIEEIRELEVKIADDQQEAAKVGAQIVNRANEADATSEPAQDSSKEEKDIVKTEMVEDKNNSLDNLNETHMETTNPVKDEAIEIGMSKPLSTANTQSIDATSAIQTANEITQPKVEVTHEKQDTLTEVEAIDIGVSEPLSTANTQSIDATSAIQTANEISQPKLEVIHEKQDTLTEVEEPLVAETNEVDSASVDAGEPSEGEKANVFIEKIEDKKDDILEDKTYMDTPNGAGENFQIPLEEVKGPEHADMVTDNIGPSQLVGKDKNMDNESLKDDKFTLLETFKDLDGGTEIAEASLEGKRSLEGLQIREETKEENLEIDKVTLFENSKNLDACGIAEISTELENSSIVAEVEEENKHGNLESNNATLVKTSEDYGVASRVAEVSQKSSESTELVEEKCGNSASNKITLGEIAKYAGVDADASKAIPVQDKAFEGPKVVQEKAKEEKDYECSITKESKEESVANEENYVETTEDIDLKEENANAESTATGSVDAEKDKESAKDKEGIEKPKDEILVLASKTAHVMKGEGEAPKQDTPAKPSQRHSNNIISKVKQSIVKAKKAIMGKSPSSKNMSAKSKEEIK